jgi:hypothetical protein
MKLYQVTHIIVPSPIWLVGATLHTGYKPIPTGERPSHISLKNKNDIVFIENSHQIKTTYDWPELFYMSFKPHAFTAMQDLLLHPNHEVYTFVKEDYPIAYAIRPASAPTPSSASYAEIAHSLPSDLHFFRKFEGTEFKLVTETFVERFQQLKFKGLKFHLRWDGEKSYPPVEHLSRAWLEEQMRKNGDL